MIEVLRGFPQHSPQVTTQLDLYTELWFKLLKPSGYFVYDQVQH